MPQPRPERPFPQTPQQYPAPTQLPDDPQRTKYQEDVRQFASGFFNQGTPTPGREGDYIRGPRGELVPVRTGAWGDNNRLVQKFGTADVRFAAPPTVRLPGVDFQRDDFTYGGVNQGQWNQAAGQAANRVGPGTNYDQAMQARQMQLAGLGQMQQSRGMWEQAAMGNGPSAAQAQLRAGVDQGIAAQMAAANSMAGGGLARAGAMQQAREAGAGMMAGHANQAAQLRANEMNQARMGLSQADQMYGGQLSQLAGQDTQRAQFLTQTEMQQRQMNDQAMMGLYGLGHQASMADLGGRQAFATVQGQTDFATQQANANLDLGHQAQEMQAITNVAGAALSGGAGLAGWAMGAGRR
jgi:hypothetical protein